MRRKPGTLYPKIEPYRQGYLGAGNGHEIYYEECGNPRGYPVIFLHGGPGAGCDANDRRFFDPKKWRVVLFDQRGSGRSRPFGSVEHNTTWDLVKDIERLRRKLGIQKWVIFGGSWGSTLALVYTITHPKTVSGLILRGIWLADKNDFGYYVGGATELWFPDVWKRFVGQVPVDFPSDPLSYYRQMLSHGTDAERSHFAYEWARYECSMLHLKMPSERVLDREIKSFPYESLAIMETHYIANGCFLEDDHILRNLDRIPRGIPISIIHGRYDAVCPLRNAFVLHQKLPWAKFRIEHAGHASSEPAIRRALVEETEAMFEKIAK